MRVATYNIDLSRKGPGLLLRDILRGDDAQIKAAAQVVAQLEADVLVLTGVDYDQRLVALKAFAGLVADQGRSYPHLFARRPNTGMQTGQDLDGDGRIGGPGDAQGFGWFAGQNGIAILSTLPVDDTGMRDFSDFLWRDLPGAILPPATDARQRLASTAHWQVPLILPDGNRLSLLIWHATPPVFDGPEDRNGRRNHDEAAFWLRLLAGELPFPPPQTPFILLGDANLDPVDGDGRPQAIDALLNHPALQDPAPRGTARRLDTGQKGDPATDTAIYDKTGGLRLDYVLPGADLRVTGSGVLWPPDDDPFAATLQAASPHRPVWIDLALP